MKLDITKNTWVNDITADFFREGFFVGTYGITVSFAGGTCPSDDIIAEILTTINKTALPEQLKIVRLRGLFDPKDNDISLFIRALHDRGFKIHIIIPSGFAAPWLADVDWTIIRNDRDVVLRNADEIWHCPADSTALKEPDLPPQTGLLYLTKGRSMVETVKFITGSKRVWRLL